MQIAHYVCKYDKKWFQYILNWSSQHVLRWWITVQCTTAILSAPLSFFSVWLPFVSIPLPFLSVPLPYHTLDYMLETLFIIFAYIMSYLHILTYTIINSHKSWIFSVEYWKTSHPCNTWYSLGSSSIYKRSFCLLLVKWVAKQSFPCNFTMVYTS